jgi:ankyrin repeat protein
MSIVNIFSGVHKSCYESDVTTVQKWLSIGNSPDFVELGYPLLFLACHTNNIEIVRSLIQFGVSIDLAVSSEASDDQNVDKTPLFEVSLLGCGQIARELLIFGAFVDRVVKGKTPIEVAAENGHLETVNVLLEYKAGWGDIDLEMYGRTGSFVSDDSEGPVDLLQRAGFLALSNGHVSIADTLFNAHFMQQLFLANLLESRTAASVAG